MNNHILTNEDAEKKFCPLSLSSEEACTCLTTNCLGWHNQEYVYDSDLKAKRPADRPSGFCMAIHGSKSIKIKKGIKRLNKNIERVFKE